MLLLLRFQHNLDDEAYEVLESYLSPVVNDSDEQGWEEITDCSLTSMLRYAKAVLPFPLVALG